MDSESDSEISIYQQTTNIYNTNINNNDSNNNQYDNQTESSFSFRHLEFDRGISYSDFSKSNKIATLHLSYIKFIFLDALSCPFIILLLFLMLCLIPCFFYIEHFYDYHCWYALSVYFILILMQIILSSIKYNQLKKNDDKVNNQSTYIYDSESKAFLKAKWKDVLPGHIIKVNKDEAVPADMIILEVSNSGHKCYVDSSGMNGFFSQLSIKTACNDTQMASIKTINIKDYINNIRGVLKYEEPNSNMNSFHCRIKMKSFPRASDVSINSLLLRGSIIRNIEHVYGLVVYVGKECKIMQYQKEGCYKPNKALPNNVFIILQKCVIVIYFIYLSILILIELHKTFLVYYASFGDNHFYLHYRTDINQSEGLKNPFYDMLKHFTKFIYLFILAIPFGWISLYQIAYFYFECSQSSSKKNIQVIHNESLTEFGRVKYILADKTGVLTSKKYDIKLCSVKGQLYSFIPFDAHYPNLERKELIKKSSAFSELYNNRENNNLLNSFMLTLCLCHSVKLPIINQNTAKNSNQTNKAIYAEDVAMFELLEEYGYSIQRIKKNVHVIRNQYTNEINSYLQIGRNVYSPTRKCMSIIVKHLSNKKENNAITLLCKSNHLSVLSKLSKQSQSQYTMIIDQIKKFESIGYHYCIILKKTLTYEEASRFIRLQKQAQNFIIQHDNHLEALANEYEQNLDYFGTLFYDEQSSSRLPYTISQLQNTKIKIWIVSGDKKDNVISIANKLDMYNPNSLIAEFSENDIDEDDLYTKMNLYLMQFLKPGGDKLFKIKTKKNIGLKSQSNIIDTSNKNLTILIHGKSFTKIMLDKNNYQRFVTLISYCKNLFAYGFSPYNKAQLCKAMKQYIAKNSNILAVCDGFNDYPLMKEADLSIGINSYEISQMKNICDVIMNNFSGLLKLLLIDGTYNYIKLKNILITSLYSNFLILSIVFLFQNACNIGSCLFISNDLLFIWRIFIMNISIVIICLTDDPVDKSVIYLNPNIYKGNFFDKSMILSDFFKEFVKCVGESIFIFYFLLNEKNSINERGNTLCSIKDISDKIFSYQIIFVIYIKMLFFKLQSIKFISFFFGILFFIICIGIDFIYEEERRIIYEMITIPTVILFWFFLTATCFIHEYIVIAYSTIHQPDIYLQILNMIKGFKGNILNNFENVLKHIYDITPILSSDDEDINKISFPEVLENFENRKEKVDLALENSKFLYINI